MNIEQVRKEELRLSKASSDLIREFEERAGGIVCRIEEDYEVFPTREGVYVIVHVSI